MRGWVPAVMSRSFPGTWVRTRRRIVTAARVAGALSAITFLMGAVLLVAIRIWWAAAPGDDQRSRGVNALWAAHTWVGDDHTESEYEEFARLLVRNEISDVFVHAGPLEGDGSVPAGRIEQAGALIGAMDRYAPGVRVQAYLGQIEDRGGGPLDLDDATVRDRIVATAESFLDLGFDGIHYDIEPIFPGDQSFFDLLDRTHALTAARGAVLSVALEQLEAAPMVRPVVAALRPGYHNPTEAFLREVAQRVDQVAIMTYDSGMPTDWLFGAYVAWQTERVVEAIGDEAIVFMGVPTYGDGSPWWFHPWAENVGSGISGVRKGLARLGDDRTENVGIAMFAEWTTSEDEWDAYRSNWVGD